MDPRTILLERPMSRFQARAVAICVALNASDGFDVLAITFAAPSIARTWGLGPEAIGIVISMGLAGMALGSILLAPLADMIGRRVMILVSLAIMAFGMLFSATAGDVYALSAWRFITGLGIGAILGSINAMVAEYANAKRRDFAVGLMAIGYPVGGVIGGSIAAILLAQFGWQAIFLFGALVNAVLFFLVLWSLPESIEFLSAKGKGDALGKANRILAKMGHPAATRLDRPADARQSRVIDIFSPAMLRTTIVLTLAYFMHTLTLYYVLGWVPSIVAGLGFDAVVGTQVSVWVNVGGILGGALLGWAAYRLGLKPLGIVALAGTALGTVAFGHTVADATMLKLVGFGVGIFLFGGIVGLYAMFAAAYPAAMRATGTGFVIGVGRAGAAIGPVLAGFLIAAELGRGEIALVMGSGSLIGALILLALRLPRRPAGLP